MTWNKKEIDKIDMMHFLGILYANTAVGYKKIGIQTLIETHARPSIVAKCRPITKAILESEILLKEGYGRSIAYKWNRDAGVPSIPMAEMLIEKTACVLREDKRETRRRKSYERIRLRHNNVQSGLPEVKDLFSIHYVSKLSC